MQKTPKTITLEQSERLLNQIRYTGRSAFAKRQSLRNYTMALCMLDAGLRVGEMVQLTINDLWFDAQPVLSLRVRPEISKSQRERTIPVSIRLCDAIRLIDQYVWMFKPSRGTSRAFYNVNQDCHISTRQVQRIIAIESFKSLGFSITPHILRHTFASRLMQTTNMRIVQQLLGHKSLTSTQIYTHPNQKDLRKAIDSLNDTEKKENP